MNRHGKFDVRAVVGGGTMYVTRDAGFEIGLMKEPYRGSVPIVSGEIAEDFAYYLAKSEQVNSAVGLGVLMTVDGADEETPGSFTQQEAEFDLDRLRVSAAGGYVIQMMPSASEDLIRRVEEIVSHAPHSTDMIKRGLSPVDMLKTVTGDLDLATLKEIEPHFHCQCSRRRALLIISALGRSEVEDMLEKDDGAELTCHFCNEVYRITGDELRGILDED
jgi:molecular chaperone Hsp33